MVKLSDKENKILDEVAKSTEGMEIEESASPESNSMDGLDSNSQQAIEDMISEQQNENELQEQYGDSKLKTFAENAASAASFGIYDQAMKNKYGKAWVEERKLREKANPGSAISGEIAGIGASMFTPGGILGQGAKVVGAGVRGAAKAGLAAERMTAKALTGLVKNKADKKIIKTILEKAAPKGVGSAVEGSFYGAGQLVSENALGEADFNAENLISSMGTGAILGAGLAGGLGAATQVGKGIARAAPSVVSKGKKLIGDATENALDYIGATPKTKAFILKEKPKVAQEMADAIKDELSKKKFGNHDDLVVAFNNRAQSAADTLDTLYSSLDDAGVNLTYKDFYGKLANDIEANLIQPRIVKGTSNVVAGGYENLVRTARKQAKKYRQLAQIDNKLTATEIRALRKEQDDLITAWKKGGRAPLKEKVPMEVRTSMKRVIDEVADKAGALGPDLENVANAIRKANRDYHVAREVLDIAEKKVNKQSFLNFQDLLAGSVGVGVGGLPGVALAGASKFLRSDLKKKLVILANIERANKKVESTIASGVKKFFTENKIPITPIATKTLLDSNFTKSEKDGKLVAPKNKKEAIDNLMETANKVSSDPEYMERRILPKLYAISQAAPETAQAATAIAMKASNFLSNKMAAYAPKTNSLFSRKYSMSDIEVDKITKYLEVIENPLNAITKLQEGTLTRAHVEALKAVYPNVYTRIQTSAMDYIGNHQDLAYNKKIQLGILLDIPADSTLSGPSLNNLQAMYMKEEEGKAGQQAQAAQAMVNPSQAGLKNLSYETRAQTATQAVVKRSTEGE